MCLLDLALGSLYSLGPEGRNSESAKITHPLDKWTKEKTRLYIPLCPYLCTLCWTEWRKWSSRFPSLSLRSDCRPKDKKKNPPQSLAWWQPTDKCRRNDNHVRHITTQRTQRHAQKHRDGSKRDQTLWHSFPKSACCVASHHSETRGWSWAVFNQAKQSGWLHGYRESYEGNSKQIAKTLSREQMWYRERRRGGNSSAACVWWTTLYCSQEINLHLLTFMTNFSPTQNYSEAAACLHRTTSKKRFNFISECY